MDFETGKTLHNVLLFEITDPPTLNTLNSFASPTPSLDEQSAYISFGAMGTAALDRETGKVLWRNTSYVVEHQTGPGSSPWLYQDLLLLTFDGVDRQFLVALDKTSGNEIWRTERTGELSPSLDAKKAFTTPLVVKHHGQEIVLSPSADWMYAYELKTGKELFRLSYEGLGFSAAPQPLYLDGRAFICTGFMKSRLLAIDMGAPEGGQISANIAWQQRQSVPCMATPLLLDKNLYFVDDKSGIASCVSCDTGDVVWRGRLGGGFSASPISAGGMIYFANRDGQVFVVKPGQELEIVAENQLDSRVMATPAVHQDALIVRTEKSLYRFSKQ